MGKVNVIFDNSFEIEPEISIDPEIADAAYVLHVRKRTQALLFSPDARERLRAIAESVGNGLIGHGVALSDVSPMRWSIINGYPGGKPDFSVRLQCGTIGGVILLLELLEDCIAPTDEFLISFFKRRAIRMKKVKTSQP